MNRSFALRLMSAHLLVAVVAAACAPGSHIPSKTTQGDGGSQGSGGSPTGAGGDVFLPDAGPSDGGLDPDSACGAITQKANATPLNLYVMLDHSSSMDGTKWVGAKAGLSAFVNDPSAAGISVALNFFPKVGGTCDQFFYKEPAVPFGLLPMNAQPIIDGINKVAPDGTGTPIYPALGGALLKGIEVVKAAPGETAAVLLVTDGLPQGPAPICAGVNPEDPQVIADLAATGVQYNPPIRTFVIGLPGVSSAFADLVAAAGGTDAAILVSSVDVQGELQKALEKVRGKALPCEYELPPDVEGSKVDPAFVNVQLTSGGASSILPQDVSCAGPGWYYDSPANPTKIIFCPASCQALKADFKAEVQILFGCKTETAQ